MYDKKNSVTNNKKKKRIIDFFLEFFLSKHYSIFNDI